MIGRIKQFSFRGEEEMMLWGRHERPIRVRIIDTQTRAEKVAATVWTEEGAVSLIRRDVWLPNPFGLKKQEPITPSELEILLNHAVGAV